MTGGSLLLEYADNPIVWAILALALFCYIVLFNFLIGERDRVWKQQVTVWLRIMPVLLSALPLLGLLGTIAGLLETFRSMAISGGLDQQTLMSSGIASALVTTQLGLFTVIPGLVLFSVIRHQYRELV